MSNGKETVIQLENIRKVYYTDEIETHALSGIHLEIEAGDYVSIAGPSGCGKSTLLNTIAGLRQMRSVSAEGVSIVNLEFELEQDADLMAQEVRDKMSRLGADLPADAEPPVIETFDAPQKGDVRDSQADISRARKLIRWTPKTRLDAGLRKTVEWFLKNG